MSERQRSYKTEKEAAYEIYTPAKVLRDDDVDGMREYISGVWVKITASFRNKHLRNLKGSRLSVWLCIVLHINEKNDSHPSIETICRETGYSNREVIDCIRELEGGKYLTVVRGQEKYNIYHVNFGAAFGKGKAPTSEETSQVKLKGELYDTKTVSQSSLKEEPVKKNQEEEENTTTGPNIFLAYQNNIGMVTPMIADSLRDAERDFPPKWIVEAIQIAVENNKRNLRYCLAILERWKREGKDEGRRAVKSNGDVSNDADRQKYVTGEFSAWIEH